MAVGLQQPTLYNYATIIRAMYGTRAMPDLSAFIRSLKRNKGLIPTKQAIPMSKQHAYTILDHLPIATMWPHWLAWKTASRWDDVRNLTAKSFRQTGPTEMLVSFVDDTKASRMDPFREDMYVLVHDHRVPAFLRYVNSLPQNSPLTTLTTQAYLKRIRLLTDQKYSAHSIKRGAVQFLAVQAAAGRLPPQVVATMAKHKRAVPTFPSTTFRYMTDKAPAARVLGTHIASKLL
jgi:hypothetical protein